MFKEEVTPSAVLHVDLTREKTERRPLAEEDRDLEIGGRGLAGAVRELDAALVFDDPDALVGIFPGRLAGVDLPGTGGVTAAWIAPTAGTVADAGFGGRLGAALARAGLAGVVVSGRARGPRGLVVRDGDAAVVEATNLAGLTTDAVLAGLGPVDGALVIGPAGLAGSPLAGAVADGCCGGGRGGLGLALAAKNCLFLAVTGHGRVSVADPGGLALAREALLRLVAASPALGPYGLGRYGSAALVDLTHGRRMMPADNFRATFFPEGQAVNAPHLDAGCASRPVDVCPGCPVGCHRVTAVGVPFPEGDALSHLTALLGLADGGLALAANALCLRLGLDPVSAAVTLACHAAISGQAMTPKRVMALLADMGARRGLGRELGLGASAYAARAGRPEEAMCVKGLELPAFDPRGAYGLALAYAVAAGGPDAWRAGCLAHELLRKPVATDRFTFDGKARAVFGGENAMAVLGSLGVCPWLALATTLEEWGQALTAVTGRTVTAGALARSGERIVYRERMQNARRGFAAKQDDLPARFFTEPGTGGEGIDIPPLSRSDFLAARDRYYRLRGLTPEGLPVPEKAAALGLAWTR